MLQSLHIENYALIERLDIELHAGFSVITGETGAGKSIILGAIELLRGQRADTRAIQQGAQRCVVEATFDIADDHLDDFFTDNDLDFDGTTCIIRREITAAGKSRSFINDTPVQLRLLNELGNRLLDIHSQHKNLLLSREDFQQSVLDLFARHSDLLARHRDTYRQWRSALQALDDATAEAQRNREEEDYLRFQFQQLDEANLRSGEQEELEQEQTMLEHAGEIRTQLQQALSCIANAQTDDADDVLQRLRTAVGALRHIGDHLSAAAELAERLQSCYIEVKDIADEVESHADNVELDPQRLQQVEERLNLLYSLQQKHHTDTVDALIALRDNFADRLAAIDNSDEHLAALRQSCDHLAQQLTDLAAQLSEGRRRAALDVEQRMQQSLQPLGMPNVRFSIIVDSDPQHHSADGCDKVQFLFSANKNATPQNLAQVASGGEIARVMLALKALMSGEVQMPTIIFDEIDTGVSGSIAEKMARMMLDMGRQHRQVISITHLPQIAALGSAHYRVYKEDTAERTHTHIAELSPEERVVEIAHMLSGETLTEAALANARQLLGSSAV